MDGWVEGKEGRRGGGREEGRRDGWMDGRKGKERKGGRGSASLDEQVRGGKST